MKTEVLSVTDFKAHCLELFDRLTKGSLDFIEVTRRGKIVAIVTPPAAQEQEAKAVHGAMKGMAVIAPDIDLTGPVFAGAIEAAEGLPRK